jgi:antigen 43
VTIVNAGIITGGAGSEPGSGVSISGSGTVTNQSGGTISGAGYGIKISTGGATILNAGQIGGTNEAVELAPGYTNRLILDPGAIFNGTVNGGNTVGAEYVTTIELASAAASGTITGLGTQFLNFGSIAFDSGAKWFISGDTSGLNGTISGFASGDTIEITGITATGSNFSDGVLTLSEASGSADLDLSGSFTTSEFVVTPVSGGDDVTLSCFRAGTRIRTTRGEVPVEHLRIRDHVEALLSGAPEPIMWIGHRNVDCTRHPDPKQVWPLRVAIGAFGPGLPHREVFLSPDHAVFMNGVLIPIKYLINGATIAQVPVDHVTYYHIELDNHDVLLAEGLPAESYLDTGDRSDFANGGGSVQLFPNFPIRMWEAKGCAPLVVTGPELDAVRRHVNARVTTPGGPIVVSGHTGTLLLHNASSR